MSRTALRLAEPPLSLERQTLADAIAEAAPLRAAVDDARTRAEAARGALALALEAGPAAERAADEARARLLADPGADRGELRRLRAAVVDAADDLAIARDVAERAETVIVEAERAERYSTERVATAADAMLVASFPAALEAAERAGREFARLAFAARQIATSGDYFNGERQHMLDKVDTLNPRFVFRSDGSAAEAARQTAAAPWQAARLALLSDPSAPLPEVQTKAAENRGLS